MRRLSLPALAATLAFSTVALAAPLRAIAFDLQLAKSDHKKLAAAVADYYKAFKEEKGTLEARGDLEETVEKLEKKAKAPILAMVEDLELVMVQAADGEDRVPGKGKISQEEERGIEMSVHAPKDYKFDSGPYPLVLTVPDAGQKADDHLRDDWLSTGAATEAVIVAVHMPPDVSDWTNAVNEAGGLQSVMVAMGSALRTYSVDSNRVYLAGKGAGVAVVAEVASLFPDRFAAVVGRAGDVGATPAENFSTIATLWISGSSGADSFAEAIGKLGYENCTVEGSTDAAGAWIWLSGQRRSANPTKVSFTPRTDFSTGCFWINAEGVDTDVEGTSVIAEADRESNTITLQVVGMTRVTVYLNDRLVDLDRPVRVVLNGVEHETQLERKLNLLLDRVYRSGDPGRIYTASRAYDVPEAE
ncbi:PHB depolymerase family esterase [Engelhardtia mirabilis]|uniref:Esterase PHB depolymerase n=1 Tax=Engelhardtia mirabilis TaxID=2528011 RepID=A0A518BKQ5_9BACT|nr:Esterase PHB depolymerase [Planctomycetes bacterium Pla133]QDV01881.1 Esterase PHB depolymerase [Planctomycetes bacterium Pla86]